MAKILLLEADRQLAVTSKAFFTKAGHELNYYADPQAAVAAADNNLPEIIIMELSLASRSGIEFLYELRSYPDWQSIPVFIIGSQPARELAGFYNSFKELNVSAYISLTASTLFELQAAVEGVLQTSSS